MRIDKPLTQELPVKIVFQDTHDQTERFQKEATSSKLSVVVKRDGTPWFLQIATKLNDGEVKCILKPSKNGFELTTHLTFMNGKGAHIYSRPATTADLELFDKALQSCRELIDN